MSQVQVLLLDTKHYLTQHNQGHTMSLNNHPALIMSANSNQRLYKFANGYGASVITGGYGSPDCPYELAVVKFDPDDNWDLCYDTEITSDVLGWLTDKEVEALLNRIEDLPQVSEAELTA